MITIPTDLVPQLEQELRKGWQKNRIEAEVQAKQNEKINKQRHKSIEGLGQLTARIPPYGLPLLGPKARI